MSSINDIPFQYLVLWAKKNKDSHPELSYLRTLSKKLGVSYPGLWGDVLLVQPSNQSLKKLQKGLNACEDAVLRDYAEDSQTKVLPVNAGSFPGFYDRVKAFITEYREELEQYRGSLTDDRFEVQRNIAIVLKEMYEYSPLHSNPLDRGKIAVRLGISRQRVDQYIDIISANCYDILSGKQVGRVVADPLLVSEFTALGKKAGTMISTETFQTSAGLNRHDGKTLDFLVNTLGMRVMDQKTGVRIPIIAQRGLLRDYSKQIGDVIDFFRKEVFGIRVDFELKDMLSRVGDKELRDAIRSLVLNSAEFIQYFDGPDAAVALRWDHLLTAPARVCWILYEKKAIDYKTAIYRDELVKLYNVEAKRYGENKITPEKLPNRGSIDSSGCWKLMCLGKTCFWKIRQSQTEEYSLDDIIRAYLHSKGARASYDDFLNYAKSLGLDRLYPNERSLYTRYIGAGGINSSKVTRSTKKVVRITKMDRQIRCDFILSSLKTLGATCSLQDLYTMFCKAFPGTLYATFSSWVRDLERQKKLNTLHGTGRRPTYVSDRSVPITIPSTPIDGILDVAEEIVWNSPGHQILTRDLFQQLVPLLPPAMTSKKQAISKALTNDPRFISTGPKGHSTVSLSKAAQVKMAKKYPPQPASASPAKLVLDEAEVKKCLLAEFSKELAGCGVDAEVAVDNLMSILGQDGPIPVNFSYYDALTYLPLHYQSTLEADRERTLKNDSLEMVELFLKNFYQMKLHKDIVADIKRDWPTVKVVGLSTIMSYMYQNYKYLPYRLSGKVQYFTPEEKIVLSMVEWVKDARNQQAVHRGQLADNSKYNKEKSIHDSFFVMLYVASQL